MKSLILHRIPYQKIEYHRGIDHNRHEVSYIGTQTALGNIPDFVNCQKLVRPGVGTTVEEAIALMEQLELQFDRVLYHFFVKLHRIYPLAEKLSSFLFCAASYRFGIIAIGI